MKKFLIIALLALASLPAFSQGHRISINSCSNYFSDFSERTVLFSGMSTDLSFIIKRFSIDIGLRYCFPREYYGRARHYALTGMNDDKSVWVNARGGLFSLGYSTTFDIIKPPSEKLLAGVCGGFGFVNHRGKYNSEPFVRIYGGSDDIHIYFLSLNAGVRFYYKPGTIPFTLKITQHFPTGKREYNSFQTSSYTQIEAGVAFPFIKSPPPDKIHTLEY